MGTALKSNVPQYLQIAEDVARRIVEGGFVAGQKLSGRSLMSSEYGVSPETIRRAFCLLADMKVLEVRPQSGAYVLSVDSARRYLHREAELESGKSLRLRLKNLLDEQIRLAKEFHEITSTIAKRQETLFSAEEQGFSVGETRIPAGAWVIGKSIGQLAFWQATGATIVAIRRGQSVIVSPGPYAELFKDDCIIYVASEASMMSVDTFINPDGNADEEGAE